MILKLKNRTTTIFNYSIFEVVTSWLDTVLSLFLHNVEDVFPDPWTDDCYPCAYTLFQLGDSLGKILVYLFLNVTPQMDVEVWKMHWPSWSFNIANQIVSFPWNRRRRSNMLSSNLVVHVFSRSLRIMG